MDRISDLPKEILQNILYFLSQQDVVRTSVLSKSWRYIWCTRPNLHLDFSDPSFERNEQKFISVVNDTLQRYCDQGLRLEEFCLTICRVYFEYSGNSIPSISFTPTSGKSNIKLYIDGVVRMPWFLKLRKLLHTLLLHTLRQSEISLDIVPLQGNTAMNIKEEILPQGMINGGNKPVVVEHLKFDSCLSFPSFLNSLFSICRPRNISPYRLIFKTQRERKKLIQCLCKTLMIVMTESGNLDLEDLWIECCDHTLPKWLPVLRAKLLECALCQKQYPPSIEMEYRHL